MRTARVRGLGGPAQASAARAGAARALTVLLAAAPACSEAEPPAEECAEAGVVLADPTAWRVVAEAEDPWGVPDAPCPSTRHSVEVQGELRWHELRTDGCSTATIRQAARVGLCAGQTVEVPVWHFPMTDSEGDWFLSVASGDPAVPWEDQVVPLPGESMLFESTFTTPVAVEAGDPIWLRLSNHGTNTWNVYALTVAPGP